MWAHFTMQVSFCRLRTHQWCFLLFNAILFHALLFGADFVEEYLLQSSPATYTDAKVLELRERARKLDMETMKENISMHYAIKCPDICVTSDVFLLSMVFSNPANGTRRAQIRQTWANLTDVKGLLVLTLFVLGTSDSNDIQANVIVESHQHKDIIQGKFNDSDGNLILKMKLMLEWVVTFCPFARFIIKSDEDMFVNYKSLVEYLLGLKRHPDDLYIGRVIHQEMPDRNAQSKDFIPLSQYSEKYYPDYCSGAAFVISQDVARKIFVAFTETNLAVPYAMFIGICAKKAGVVPTHSSRFSGEKHIRYNRCCYSFMFTSAQMQLEELPTIWNEAREGKACSLLETYSGLVSCKALTYLDRFSFFSTGKINEK
ncbi:beta-1,3-galactosyltransferase 9 [Erpetoichthys calabaricus]|uniref:beta-1,3-galactosyltransferase 9 n=1 Tax=Erpetoichthys calabaricus TaxID=27687 RepID=UPI00223442F7|nr:beta-1,3-galactosyltransferase 9 [Erpetoichthys calabaricus]